MAGSDGKRQTAAAVALAARARRRPGRRRRERASEAQRARILAAMVNVACEEGVPCASVERVVGVAGVSSETFYAFFEDRSECVTAAIEQVMALACERASAAYEAEDGWEDRVRAGLSALLEFFDEEPQLARLCVVQSPAAGPAVLARRVELLDQLARVVDQGRAGAPRQPPLLTAEGVVGGALALIHARLVQPEPGALLELSNMLMSFIVLPYRGAGAARMELSRAIPGPSVPAKRKSMASPPGFDVRLTCRTISVLAALAAEPGLANRQVSVRAGVKDQRQISRLLARLARLGLIENTRAGQTRSAANAWRLTRRGKELEKAIGRESLGTER